MVSSTKLSRQQLRSAQRKLAKAQRAMKTAEHQVFIKINHLLKRVLTEDALTKIAKKTGFCLRQRLLPSFAIIVILLMGCSDPTEIASLERLCAFLRSWFKIFIVPQSLQKRLSSPKTVAFVKEITQQIMMAEANTAFARLLRSKGKRKSRLFQRILLQDSTVISLPETVARIFRGCGGAASKAAVKCDLIFDQLNRHIIRIKCVAGKIPDANLSDDILAIAEENDLVIRDLGYFILSQFNKMISRNIKFISRLYKNVYVYLNKTDEKNIDIIAYLNSLQIEGKGIDLNLFIGKTERLPVRLVGLKVPAEVAEARRQRHKQARGTETSEGLQEWNGYTLMITNIPQKDASIKFLLKMYAVRWQIELFFKNMKSHLGVDNLSGTNKNRILCLIYLKLTITWIISILFAHAQAFLSPNKPISRDKFIKWLRAVYGFKNIFRGFKDITELINALRCNIDLLFKQERKRTAFWEQV